MSRLSSVSSSDSSSETSSRWQRNPGLLLSSERVVQVLLGGVAGIPVGITFAVISILLFWTGVFFSQVNVWQLVTDSAWSPQFPKDPQYGLWIIASGTLLITAIALLVAIPVGAMAAIYLNEYASRSVYRWLKPGLDALASIPTVVLGYFALRTITPALEIILPGINKPFNALSAGLVTGFLIVPIIASITEDALRSVPKPLREGGLSLGFTQREVITRILMPVAFPGFVAACTLAASRALGESMIAIIAGGQTPQFGLNPLEAVETMTAFIVQVSLGTPDTKILPAIFTVGMILFLISLVLNTVGHVIVREHRLALEKVVIPVAQLSQPTDVNGFVPHQELGELKDRPHAETEAVVPTFNPGLAWRERFDQVFKGVALLATCLSTIVLIVLLGSVLMSGLASLDWQFLTGFPSRNAAESGILPALLGTLEIAGLTAVLAFPIGIGAAVFLEEYVPETAFSRLLSINIANLGAMPSILYGLLGLELFVRWFRPISGGPSILSAALTLTVIVLPLLITVAREALRNVPDSLRQAGYGVGMSQWQVLFRVVVPAALPTMGTGMVLSLSRGIGETAPLIAIGAAAAIRAIPSGLQSEFTTLPVQIFYWVSRPQAEFQDNAAAATLVLISLLIVMNGLVVLWRERYRSIQH